MEETIGYILIHYDTFGNVWMYPNTLGTIKKAKDSLKPLIYVRNVWFYGFFHFGFIDKIINEILPENQCIFT